jgi:acetate kinase
MKVLVLNCGSSSIKYKLFDMDHKEVIAQGGIEKIGLKGSFLKLTLPDGGKKSPIIIHNSKSIIIYCV